MKLFLKPDQASLITLPQLHAVFPIAPVQILEVFHEELNNNVAFRNISTRIRLASFIAQVSVDTNQLTEVTENLNYSARRILSVWPNEFVWVDKVQSYAYNPERLGNFLYANKYGNSNSASGDGYKYRGRGWVRGIGKDYYEELTQLLGIDFLTFPDLLAAPRYASFAASTKWNKLNLNKYADIGDIKTIFIKLNGRSNHIKERMAAYERIYEVLTRPENALIMEEKIFQHVNKR